MKQTIITVFLLIIVLVSSFHVRAETYINVGKDTQATRTEQLYKRGVGNIWGHVLKFINLLHILTNVTGSYGV